MKRVEWLYGRCVVLSLVLGVAGCDGCDGEDATPRPGSPEHEGTASASEEADDSVEPSDRDGDGETAPTPPSAEELRRVRATVAAGRAAFRREEYDEALAAFRRAIALTPRDPRLYCEAGFVAERGGMTGEAEPLLKLGLAIFGSSRDVSPALRVPLAMCLFNYGQLCEDVGREEDAGDAYRRSLALRDNDAVRRALIELATSMGDDDGLLPLGTLAGVKTLLEEQTQCADYMEQAGRCRGTDVSMFGERPAGDGFGASAFFSATVYNDMADETTIYLAIQEGVGFRLFYVAEQLSDNTDHGSTFEQGLEAGEASEIAPGWWRFDTHVSGESGSSGYIEPPENLPPEEMRECYFDSSGTSHRTVAILCRLGSPIRCAGVPLGGRSSGGAGVSCADDEPAPPWADDYEREEGGESRYEISLEVDPARGVRLVAGEGYADRDAPECIAIGEWVDPETLFDGDCAVSSR